MLEAKAKNGDTITEPLKKKTNKDDKHGKKETPAFDMRGL